MYTAGQGSEQEGDRMSIRYYVIAYIECPTCNGTNAAPRPARIEAQHWFRRCDDCNEQGEVEAKVPLAEALEAMGVTGFWKGENDESR